MSFAQSETELLMLAIAFAIATVVLLVLRMRRRTPVGTRVATPVAIPVEVDPGVVALPKIAYEEDESVEPTCMAPAAAVSPPMQKIVYEDDAAIEEPTHPGALILVTAMAGTDPGLRRKRNEDSILAREDFGLFVVADGMGGHSGGAVASDLAVRTIEHAYERHEFRGPHDDVVPRRASELGRSIQMANEAIFARAGADKLLAGMGTTICAARFSPSKQRVYVGHVGDSRVYLFRNGRLRQMTVDHTMKTLGVDGEGAGHLSRAVGVWPVVPVDIVLGKPKPGDLYLLCSDSLTKMVPEDVIAHILATAETPRAAVDALIAEANSRGGKDNIAVIVVRVDDPVGHVRGGPRVAA